ncbi:MAG: alpha/beta hydrolase fold domain-containing protein [Candidatus Binatia bacterium]
MVLLHAWVPWLFLVAALVGAWFTYNAYRPIHWPAPVALASFFAGWLTTELAFHHLAWQLAMTLGFMWAGALAAWPGWVGLGITLVSWGGLARCYATAGQAEWVVESALAGALGSDYIARVLPAVREQLAPSVDWWQIALPFPMRHRDVERVRDVEYHRAGTRRLRLDVYRRRDHPTGCPTLLQIHGGGWMVGSKNEQGVPLMLHLAARGWVCVSADYRLSPYATFPDPLVDVKHAIRWIREHAAAYGANPDFLVVTGGSAGGHLAALVALTGNDAEYQPGFEDVDTSVRGCVAFYGVYDFTNRHGHYRNPGLEKLLERYVMKTKRAHAGDAYEKASPMSRVHAAAPPFFVIHGDRDTLVPVAEARRFSEALRTALHAPVAYAEIPGAQHAFEIFPSLRTTFVVHGVERFLAWLYSRYLTERGETGNTRVSA